MAIGASQLCGGTEILLCLSLHALVLANALDPAPVPPPPTATTQCGEVEGLWKDGAAVFNGIPYAKPPLGERRWRPSEALEKEDGCWQGTLQAKTLGNVCVQLSLSIGLAATDAGDPMIGHEDCLSINIITHNLNHSADAGLLPVAVWIHGGGLVFGSGGDPMGYTPTPEFARNTGVVSVSFNYRLNIFGFLALSVFDTGTGAGNYGFYDQILALKWVQQNIASFGGDKKRVMVYGQSSGGTSVVALLASPLAKGLFHRAVMMSASPNINCSLTDAYTANVNIMLESGCRNSSCLRSLPAEKVLRLAPQGQFPYWYGGDTADLPTLGLVVGPVAVIDGVLLPKSSLDSIAHGLGSDVSVIVGTCAQEPDIQPPDNIRNATWSQYDTIVKKHMDTFQRDPSNQQIDVYAEVRKLYPHNMSVPSGNARGACVTNRPEFLLTTMVADVRVICANQLLARHYAKYLQSYVYNYVTVQCPSSGLQGEFGAHYAYHMFDLNALFNFTFAPKSGVQPDDKDLKLASITQKWFKNFAYGLTPDPLWKPVEEGTYLLMYEPVMMDGFYHKEQCTFFNSHGFPPYSWQN